MFYLELVRSQAYRLYDPISQKIIVNRDVKFEEENSWDWNMSHDEAIIADLDWGKSDKEAVPVDTDSGNRGNIEVDDSRGNIEADHHDNTIENMEGNDSDESNEEHPPNHASSRMHQASKV